MDSNPLRVIIWARVMDIPSKPGARPGCLGDIFCQQVLGREMNHDLNAACHDADHCLPFFDSQNDVRAWFLHDFNVTGPLDKTEVVKVAHRVYLATRKDDGSW